MTTTEHAAAKVNLALAAIGQRADGYHLLDTVAVFADVGDTLHALPGDGLTLEVDGPFAGAVEAGPTNLVLRAAWALVEAAVAEGRPLGGARLRLNKALPVAAGLGGGSADAAAALRALDRLWNLDFGRERLAEIGADLGADVAMCVHGRALRGGGIGEEVTMLGHLPRLALVLANPGVELSTAAVFAALDGRFSEPLPEVRQFTGPTELAQWLAATRNDLEAPACRLVPQIEEVLAELRRLPDCLIARMSGSGATCFGFFPDSEGAERAAAALATARPGWWVVATMAG